MNRETLELVPFKGRWCNIGGKTADSVVGRLYNPLERQKQEKPVLKWSRRSMGSAEEAIAVGHFIHQSLLLYEASLGREYLVPTSVVVGAKKDGTRSKFKVYIVQPCIDGWNGRDLPEEMRDNPSIVDQWMILYHRLSRLYNTARTVNRRLSSQSHPFPINLTVGDSRDRAAKGISCGTALPTTPNILIDRQTLRISLCDFGRYTAWEDDMGEAYTQIKAEVG